jgi:alanine racemase
VIRLADLLVAEPQARVEGAVAADWFDGFCFDSRIVRPGELFVAFRTAKGDGHDFIQHACRGGAAGVLARVPVDVSSFGVTFVVVPDTERALQRYASHVMAARALPVVGIGGSVGKTSTKEAVASALAAAFHVFRNPANYSGRFGLPLALGELRPEHQVAVMEMASGHFGETGFLARLVPPKVAVVTAVTPVHMATFGTVEKAAEEYADLVSALPADGLAVLNADDPRVLAMAARTDAETRTCSVEGRGDFRAGRIRVDRAGTSFELLGPEGGGLDARIPWVGAHFVRAALVAAAVGVRFGLTVETVLDRLRELRPLPGRLRPLEGRSGALVLDDTYNSSPAAALAALDTLAALDGHPRIALLGDMEELGEHAEVEHRRVGRRAAEVVDVLVTKGPSSASTADEARDAGMAPDAVSVAFSAEDAVAAVERHLAPGAVVLAKGSTAARMEHVVGRLLRTPSLAPEVLVRQDAAWRQLVVVEADRPTWLEIDHGAIGRNVRRLRSVAAPAAVMAVLKADAYGHGAVRVAHTAINNGATWFGVACLSEGEALRGSGIQAPILALGYTPAWQARRAVGLGISVAVFDEENAVAFARAAEEVDGHARLHVKVDTGMHRLGMAPDEVPGLLERLTGEPRALVEGVFTHFASSDDPTEDGRAATRWQLERFRRLVEDLESNGLRPPLVHAANSAAALTLPGSHFDLVRTGIALYGLSPWGDARADGLQPAMAWKTQIAQVRRVDAGESVGYGRMWRAERQSTIATIPVGYADGFRRAPTTWRHVLVRGCAAPVVGRVSMDQASIDVTSVPDARQGDEVVLIGEQRGARITAEDVAEWLGTNSYEVVAEILPRVPRVS